MPRHARSRSHRQSTGARQAVREQPASNHPGIHLLRDRGVAQRMVHSSGAGPGDLVVEFGAGAGALTGPLADTGARVIAVERDARFAARLQRRFAGHPGVRVVHADALTVALPRRRFMVVANIPYAISTALLRRLLGDPHQPPANVVAADLMVEWGFAKRVTGPPRDLRSAWWQAQFELHVARRVPARCFQPAPSVDSAHLVIRRRSVPAAEVRAGWRLLRDVARSPARPAKEVLGAQLPKKRAHRLLTSTGVDPPAPAGTVPTALWLRWAEEITRKA